MSRKTESEGHCLSAASFVACTGAFAQPKREPLKRATCVIGKLLNIRYLSLYREVYERNSQAGLTRLKCIILHIRCRHEDLGFGPSLEDRVRTRGRKVRLSRVC